MKSTIENPMRCGMTREDIYFLTRVCNEITSIYFLNDNKGNKLLGLLVFIIRPRSCFPSLRSLFLVPETYHNLFQTIKGTE